MATQNSDLNPHPSSLLPHPSLPRRLGRQLLGLPLFLKVLVANSVIVGLGAFIGTALTQAVVSQERGFEIGLAVFFTFVGVSLSAVVNYVVLKTAFRPLSNLQRAAINVRSGNYAARAEMSPLTDPQMEQLTDTFNTMLDTLEERNSQLRRVAHLVLGAQEEERKRIARELHDQTAQSLTTLLVRLKLLERADSPEAVKQGLQEMRSVLATTMDDVRELSRSLRPTLLDDLGLVPALEAYLSGLAERVSEKIVFKVEGFESETHLADPIELVCYRVVQEAVTNVLKYAHASKITVTLTRDRANLTAEVQDDGQGFDPTQLEEQRPGGLGLLGMRERAILAGGRLSLNSTPGEGTTVCLQIPLTPLATLGYSE